TSLRRVPRLVYDVTLSVHAYFLHFDQSSFPTRRSSDLHWTCKNQMIGSTSTHHVLKVPLLVGWMISMIGLFHVNYGGDTKFQHGTTRKLVRFMLVWKHQLILKTGNKILMCWIRGSHQHCGHFQQWVGLTQMQRTSNVTSQLIRWLRDMTLFSSGLPA